MRWNPILNAVYAAAYIALIALVMQFIQFMRHDTPDTPLDLVALLSLLVFSAATMSFLFFYRPLVLLIENKKPEAVSYFLQTLGTFGMITVLVIVFVSLL